MDTNAELQAVNLCCVRQSRIVFSNLSFHLQAGRALIIEGANGSGKSSLLRLLSGLAAPDAGSILWRSKSISDSRDDYITDMHFVGHQNGLKLGLTVNENLQLLSSIQHRYLPNYNDVLKLLELSDHADQQTSYLSAGQKRRVALAKLFLFPKKIWLLDEPLTALDQNMQALFLTQLGRHLELGGLAIISSHHPIILANASTLRLSRC